MQKEKYIQELMCLNRKLDLLGRQNLLKGAQGAYKWLMASFGEFCRRSFKFHVDL